MNKNGISDEYLQELLRMGRELNAELAALQHDRAGMLDSLSGALGVAVEDVLGVQELPVPHFPETREEWEQCGLRCQAEYEGYLETLGHADRHLLAACDAKDATALRAALAEGANPNLRTTWYGAPLAVYALTEDWPEGTELLLDAGADPLAEEAMLLMQLCERGPAELLRRVLDSPGVSADYDDGAGYNLADTAAEAGRVDCLRVLRAAGADMLANDGRTLCKACDANQPEVVRYLLEECGADIEAEYDDWSPLFYAVRSDSLECARILLEAGADPLHCDIANGTPFGRAASPAMHSLLDRYIP